MRNKSLLSVLMFVAAIVWLGGLSMPVAFGAADNISYQGSFPTSTAAGMTHAVLTINGTPRDLLIYRPSTAQSLPLLIFFDGTGSDFASIAANDGYFRGFADNWNTIIAVPAQRVMSYGDWDNHSAETPYFETAVGESTSSAVSSNPDTNPDLLFTRAIIKEASIAYGADLTRVYVNGFSNGAFFSYFVAATLNDKIAAFAETGGGLVLSNTTAGEPTPCAPTALPAATGAVRSCAAAGWTAGLCSTAGAIARPIAPASVVSVPPGFMEANDDDTTVPWAHTCNLANALPVSSNYQVRIVHSGIGHSMNDDYLNNSWNFMKKFSTNTVTQSGDNNCAASVSSSLVVHIPVVTYNGANYWADLHYNSGDSTLTVANAGIISDMSPYSSCAASTLSSDLKLHIPALILDSTLYWVDLRYDGSFFIITGYGQTRPYLILHGTYAGTMTDASFIASNADFLDTLPFDGLFVPLGDLSFQVMDSRPLSYGALAAELAPMKAKKPKNVTQNFALVSRETDPVTFTDFFDDWTIPIQNFANVARASRDAGLVGIAFDNEDYARDPKLGGTPWSIYPDNCKYGSTKTLAEYQTQVRLRGKEIMSAMIKEFPAIVVVSFYGPYVSEPKAPLPLDPGDPSDLHGPLFAGFVEAAKEAKEQAGATAKVIDGGELYDLRTKADFKAAFQFRKVNIASDTTNCAFIPPSLRPSWPYLVGIGFGLYDRVNDGLDYPLLDVTLVRPNVTNALRQSDSYVWFYTEKIDFLKPASAGGAPAAWVDAVRQGKNDGLAGWKAPWP